MVTQHYIDWSTILKDKKCAYKDLQGCEPDHYLDDNDINNINAGCDDDDADYDVDEDDEV